MIYIIEEITVKDAHAEDFLHECKKIQDIAEHKANGHVRSVLLSTDTSVSDDTDDIVISGPNTFTWICEWESYNHYVKWMQELGETDEGKLYVSFIESRKLMVLENRI